MSSEIDESNPGSVNNNSVYSEEHNFSNLPEPTIYDNFTGDNDNDNSNDTDSEEEDNWNVGDDEFNVNNSEVTTKGNKLLKKVYPPASSGGKRKSKARKTKSRKTKSRKTKSRKTKARKTKSRKTNRKNRA